jgi:hypothetical protein
VPSRRNLIVTDDTGLKQLGFHLFKALDAAPPHNEGQFHPDMALTLPAASDTADLAFGFGKNGHELNWA